jgi:hypothetical protein
VHHAYVHRRERGPVTSLMSMPPRPGVDPFLEVDDHDTVLEGQRCTADVRGVFATRQAQVRRISASAPR